MHYQEESYRPSSSATPPASSLTPLPSPRSALGNTTKFASTPSDTRFLKARQERYRLRELAGEILFDSRVGWCGKWVVPDREVQVRCEEGRCFYGGLISCGSVWTCPVCSAKVATHRAEELRQGIRSWRANGGVVTMVVLTVRHNRWDDLDALQKAFSKAQRRLKSGGAWQQWQEDHGYVGDVANLEVTWGPESGWHPHAHRLLFTKRPIDDGLLLFRLWETACAVEGLEASWEAFRGGLTAADEAISGYLTKVGQSWSAAEELAYGHRKRGNGRLTPFDLLRELEATEESLYAALFGEYAEAFRGRSQLRWSRGLRKRLEAGLELSDEAVANVGQDGGEVLAVIDKPTWQRVVRAGLRLKLLEAAEVAGVEGIETVLQVAWGWSSWRFSGKGLAA